MIDLYILTMSVTTSRASYYTLTIQHAYCPTCMLRIEVDSTNRR